MADDNVGDEGVEWEVDTRRIYLDIPVDRGRMVLESGEGLMSHRGDVDFSEKYDAAEVSCGCHVGNQRRVELASMGDRQESHLFRLKSKVIEALDAKYRSGQALHGGFLLDIGVSGLLHAAIDEALDQVTYLLSLKELLNGTRSERK